MQNKNRRHENFENFENFLQERLKDPELACAYLNEALADEDQRVFLLALKDVRAAQGEEMLGKIVSKMRINN
jgi:DNA-binding phage protein